MHACIACLHFKTLKHTQTKNVKLNVTHDILLKINNSKVVYLCSWELLTNEHRVLGRKIFHIKCIKL